MADIAGWHNRLLIGAADLLAENDFEDVVFDCRGSGTVVRSLDDADTSRSITPGDTISIDYDECDGSTGQLRLVVNEAATSNPDSLRLAGDVTANLSGGSGMSAFSIRDSHFMRVASEDTQNLVTRDAEITRTDDTTLNAPDASTDHVTNLSVVSVIQRSGEYDVSISGRLESDRIEGTLDFDTPASYKGVWGNYPDEGFVQMLGAESSVDFAANADPYFQREVANYRVSPADPDVSDRSRRVLWERVLDSALFGVFERYVFRGDTDPRFDQAPYIAEIDFRPQAPKTTDDLDPFVHAEDPEGATLELTYAWYLNGELIAEQTGHVLPAATHSRDDVISLEVTASDGRLSSSLRRDITILDTPPVFSLLSSPPEQVSHGETVSFRMGFVDPDSDPLPETPFRVDHGPGGMVIDGDGRVTWTPGGPMFDRTTDFNWRISAPGFPGSEFGGVIRVEDPTADYPLMRTGLQVNDASLILSDVDSNGATDMLVIDRGGAIYELQWNGTAYAQTWAYPLAIDEARPEAVWRDSHTFASSATTADIDGDGLHELFLATTALVVKLDGRERRAVAVAEIGRDYACGLLAYEDLDADGDEELVCVTGEGSDGRHELVVLDARTLAIEARTPLELPRGPSAISNVDNDAALEIVGATGLVYDGATLEREWDFTSAIPVDRPSDLHVLTGDIDGDGVDEIVLRDGLVVRAASGLSRAALFEFTLPFTPHTFLLGDMDGDDTEEILIGLDSVITAYRFDEASSSLVEFFSVDDRVLGDGFEFSVGTRVIGTGDMDGDGALEFIWLPEGTLIVTAAYPGFEVQWSGFGTQDFGGPFAGGELATLAPGDRKVVFSALGDWHAGNSPGPRLLAVDPQTGQYSISPRNIGRHVYEPAVIEVSDFDLDGVDDVFLSTEYTGDPFFTVREITGDLERWRSPEVAATAIAIENADVTGDGRDEFIAVQEHTGDILVYDIARNTLVWENDGVSLAIALADIDADGALELIAGQDNGAVATFRMTADGGFEQLAYFEPILFQPTYIAHIAVGDTDGDGEVEIFTMDNDHITKHVMRLSKDLQLLSRFEASGDMVGLYLEPPGAGQRNLILAESRNSRRAAGARLYGVDPVTGVEVWRSPLLMGAVSPGSLQHVDVDGDGELEMTLGTEFGVMITR